MSDPLDWPLLDVLAGTIVGEASNQEMIGQIAIGCVIRNRARIAEAFFKRTGQPYWWAKVAGIPSTDVWRSVMLQEREDLAPQRCGQLVHRHDNTHSCLFGKA